MPYIFVLLVAVNAMYLGFSLLKDSRGDSSVYAQTVQHPTESDQQKQ